MPYSPNVGKDQIVSNQLYSQQWPSYPNTYYYPYTSADAIKNEIAKKVLNDKDLTKDKKLEILKYVLS